MSTTNTTTIPIENNQYGYNPSEAAGIVFIALFGISTILHIAQATYYKMWWLFPTACLCGVGELVGWSGRLWSSFNPDLADPYMMQITTTIISPTPLIAVNFILLSRMVERLGIQYSFVSARWYTTVFLCCDIVALVVQGAGGGLAASANTPSGAQLGANIMLAGIVFQFVAIIVYTTCAVEFLRRYAHDLPARGQTSLDARKTPLTPHLRSMIGALAFSTLVLFIRSVYRIIELSGGWSGPVILTQKYFLAFDGAMIVLAIYTMNIFHPGRLLPPVLESEFDEVAMKRPGSRGSSQAMLV
ncbi:RTA1-domain-containing protein [Mycena metata]|uniref:RTA1-domain-containing protein n=1 Tax=Mycena metata TaxID=1033252 RepID=A0AAD7I2L9_9AGAR|nr:RTA1-domain-containing protein [Mycena metata]